MDIVRPEIKHKKKMRRIAYIVAAVVLIPLVTYALSRLKPAAPSVDRGTVWTGTVKRGPMLRDVRGLGTLVPETIRLIPAVTDGQVQTRYLLPGTPVKANTVIFGSGQSAIAARDARRGIPIEGRASSLRQTQGAAAKSADGQTHASREHLVRNIALRKCRKTTTKNFKRWVSWRDFDRENRAVQAEELAKQNDMARKRSGDIR